MKANEDVQVLTASDKKSNGKWGVWLFRATVAATLIYFWWLLIYSHGIASQHP